MQNVASAKTLYNRPMALCCFWTRTDEGRLAILILKNILD